jgi:hypothetical protein
MEELIQSLPTPVFVGMLVIGVGMASIMLFAGLQARSRAALVKATPTSPIAFAEDGYRQVEGVIEAVEGKTLKTPLTGWDVVWYRIKVEQQTFDTSDPGRFQWKIVSRSTSSAPFLLRDSTGACRVRPMDAEVTPTDKSVWFGPTEHPQDRNPPRLAPTDPSTPLFQSGATDQVYRYTEERLYAGDALFALGHFSSGRFTGKPATAAALHPDPDDAPEDEADLDEDERVEKRAEQAAAGSIAKGKDGPLILSTTPEASHVAMTEYGGQAAIYMGVGAFGLVALLAWIRFGS